MRASPNSAFSNSSVSQPPRTQRSASELRPTGASWRGSASTWTSGPTWASTCDSVGPFLDSNRPSLVESSRSRPLTHIKALVPSTFTFLQDVQYKVLFPAKKLPWQVSRGRLVPVGSQEVPAWRSLEVQGVRLITNEHQMNFNLITTFHEMVLNKLTGRNSLALQAQCKPSLVHVSKPSGARPSSG